MLKFSGRIAKKHSPDNITMLIPLKIAKENNDNI